MNSKKSDNYQDTLRAIGQGIEQLGIEVFQLEASGDHDFVVSGVYRQSKNTSARKLKKSFLSLIMDAAQNLRRGRNASTLFQFSGIRFNRSDIDILDRAGKASRSSEEGRPRNPLGIAHVLRMAGVYLDSKGSQFARLSWNRNTLTLWHISSLGVEAKEIFTPHNLYDYWVHYIKTRKPHRVLKPAGKR